MWRWWLLVAACASTLSAECRVACKYEGYDGGYYADKNCVCLQSFLYSDLLGSMKLPAEHKAMKQNHEEDTRELPKYDQ